MLLTEKLGVLDWCALGAVIGIAACIGLWTSRKNRSGDAFLLGDRNMPWWAIMGSIVATETSAITVLSVTGLGFGATGMKYLQLALGLCLGKLIVSWVLMPRFFDGQLMSAYEVLEAKLGKRVRRYAAGMFLVARNIGDGLRLSLAAMVIQELLGWSYVYSALAIGLVTIAYTLLGGMRSVVWNDCVQLLIYIAGGVATLFVVANALPNGWQELVEFGRQTGRLNIFEFGFSISNPWTIWAGVIGGAFLSLGTHGTDHMMVQRYLSAGNTRDASRALIVSGFAVFVQFALFLFVGISLACFYQNGGVTFDKPDKVFVHFVLNHFPMGTGLIGLILAAILAATMSTLSSSLTASSSSLIHDLWLPFAIRFRLVSAKPIQNHDVSLTKTRAVIAAFGAIQITIGIWAGTWHSSAIEIALAIAGFVFGLLLGLFALVVFVKRIGEKAAIAGGLFGLGIALIVKFVLPIFGISVAFDWLALVGATSTFASGWLWQYFFNDRP